MHLFMSNFRKNLIKIGIIIILCIVILSALNSVFKITWRPKDNLYYFYQLEKESLDVIHIGSSHVYHSINPIAMYETSGIASYNLAAGSQSIWYSYYYIKEALKTQKPKVIVLDVYTLQVEDDSQFVDSAQLNLLAGKMSVDKLEALEISDVDDKINLFLGFPKNHIRYRELDVEEYNDKICLSLMGYAYSGEIKVWNNKEELNNVLGIKEQRQITDKSELYLRKIIELCQDKNIDIVLVNSPWPGIRVDSAKKYNYIAEIAKEYEIDFLNGCLLIDEIGIDYEKDIMDEAGHLNYYGSLKWTNYLTEYLVDNFDLPDHRDEDIVIWEECQRALQNELIKTDLRSINNAIEYLQYLQKNQVCAFAMIIDEDTEIEKEMAELIEMMGMVRTERENGYLLRMPNQTIVSRIDFSSDTKLYNAMYDDICNYKDKNEEFQFLKMQFNDDIAEGRKEKGIYFIVFDSFRNAPLDAVEFRQEAGFVR